MRDCLQACKIKYKNQEAMKTVKNCEILERTQGGISTSVFEGSLEEVQNWISKNTMVFKNRGIFTDLTDLDCQTKDEFDLRIEIRINANAVLRTKQIREKGTISTYSFVSCN